MVVFSVLLDVVNSDEGPRVVSVSLGSGDDAADRHAIIAGLGLLCSTVAAGHVGAQWMFDDAEMWIDGAIHGETLLSADDVELARIVVQRFEV